MRYPRAWLGDAKAVNIRGRGDSETGRGGAATGAKTDARTEDLSQEIRDVSKYFSDFSIRSGTRGALSGDRAPRATLSSSPSVESAAPRYFDDTTRGAFDKSIPVL